MASSIIKSTKQAFEWKRVGETTGNNQLSINDPKWSEVSIVVKDSSNNVNRILSIVIVRGAYGHGEHHLRAGYYMNGQNNMGCDILFVYSSNGLRFNIEELRLTGQDHMQYAGLCIYYR